MSSGIRATVTVSTDGECPIARFASATGTVIDRVSTSVAPAGTESVSEFVVDVGERPDSPPEEPVFSYGTATLYRVEHGTEPICPCACLGRFGCPVHRYAASGDEVTLVFHAESFDQLQAVIGEFRERFPAVDVKRLLQPPLSGDPEERVFVNWGKLTDRQREVLETAYGMGYFERPREANATEVADELGVAPSTVSEHLRTAQRKIFEDLLESSV
ncbi:helix-turn-helix domain-containing protein [Natronorarus salvus]|uniref:helix-turn-helix domain-containing protein n=1 Tax=Natronorarus salvus TaxID=3117733 RepID=UPI002F26BEE8